MSPAEYEAMQRRCLANLEKSLQEVDQKIADLKQLRDCMRGDVSAIKGILSSSDSGLEKSQKA